MSEIIESNSASHSPGLIARLSSWERKGLRFLSVVLLFSCVAFVGPASAETTTDEIYEEPITEFDRDHWSFQPLTRPALPAVKSDDGNPIDRFIESRLQASKLRPLPQASRTTLLRRLKFDLLGLPPTSKEVQAFVNDESPDAYPNLVDRFLGSPHYGERWAQHWLDLARFAETDGFEHDKVRSEAWKYRDWVIAALNEDMPYDRFLQLQIAGDELEPGDKSAKIATAFCLSGPDMPDINSQDERRHNLLNEMTSTIGSVVLGLQLGCAQCHDHKFDPISQADFYRMRAFFDSSVNVKANKSVFTLSKTDKAAVSHVMLRGDYRTPGPRIDPGFVRIAASPGSNDNDLSGAKNRAQLAKWLTRSDHPLTARVMVNRVWQHHFGKGLSNSSSDFGVMGEEPTHPELLDWLATEFVRHQWRLKSLHRLIVTSAAYRRSGRATDIGSLNTLTLAERRDRIQSAQTKDPQNALLARFPRRRLEGEVLRDAMLCVSETIDWSAGGPGVMPPLPPEVLNTLLRKQWKEDEDESQHTRRSAYVFARRNLRYPIFDVFDRPDGNASCACRDESTTATQSLLMLNSRLSLDTARKLAKVCLRRCGGDFEQAVALAVLKCFGRPIQDEERKLLALNDAANIEDELVQICLGLLNANEFFYVD